MFIFDCATGDDSADLFNGIVRYLDDAKSALTRLYTALKSVPSPSVPLPAREGGKRPSPSEGRAWDEGTLDWDTPYATSIKAAMDDDFNTPEAVAVLFDLANEVNRSPSSEAAAQLKALAGVLGLLQRDAQEFLQGSATIGGLDDTAINAQIEARIAAK